MEAFFLTQPVLLHPSKPLKVTWEDYIIEIGSLNLDFLKYDIKKNGGIEKPFDLEDRILVPSPKVATYDLQPEMSAYKITSALIERVKTNAPNLIVLNYANTDMVGHTGDFAAAMESAQAVDNCLNDLIPELLQKDYGIILIADHGNSDFMVNPDNSPNTAHTMNPVPIVFVSNEKGGTINTRKLADIAPTILDLMEIEIPKEMTGEIIIK